MTSNGNSLADIQAQIKQHDDQIAQLRRKADAVRKHERTGVIDEVRKKIAEYDLTASDLKLGNGRRGTGKRAPAVKGVAKYRGPNGETWSGGRGRKPRWVTEALAAGKSLSDFEIK